MRKTQLATAFMLFGMTAMANAGVINVSLNVNDWEKTPYIAVWQAPATVTNTLDDHLLGTKTTATGGTNWSLGIHTVSTYNFQDAVLRYNWRLNGQGNYSGIYTGVDLDTGHLINNFDPNLPYAGHMTTSWSWAGSEIIPSNTWLWTEIIFSETGYDFAVSLTGYGNMDFLHGTKAISAPTWAALANAHPFFQIGDNYTAGAYFEVAELSITTQQGPSIPEPASLALLAVGLAGMGAVRRRKTTPI